jgi:hypothetical protein
MPNEIYQQLNMFWGYAIKLKYDNDHVAIFVYAQVLLCYALPTIPDVKGKCACVAHLSTLYPNDNI